MNNGLFLLLLLFQTNIYINLANEIFVFCRDFEKLFFQFSLENGFHCANSLPNLKKVDFIACGDTHLILIASTKKRRRKKF